MIEDVNMNIVRMSVPALLLALSACAAPGVSSWTHPEADKRQTQADYLACRNDAQSDVSYVDDRGRGGDPMREMERQDEAKRVKRQVAACMIGKGYKPK